MSITRLSPDEFVDKMRSCKKWAVNLNRFMNEAQLTVCTQSDIFENWLGPDPRDLSEEDQKAFFAKVERAMRIYHDREMTETIPDGGYPTPRLVEPRVIHRTRHRFGKE